MSALIRALKIGGVITLGLSAIIFLIIPLIPIMFFWGISSLIAYAVIKEKEADQPEPPRHLGPPD